MAAKDDGFYDCRCSLSGYYSAIGLS